MKRPFPKVKDGQYVLVRADVNTGIILDEEFEYATSGQQKVYEIFDSLESSIRRAESLFSRTKGVEILVYDANQKPVHVLRP